MNFSLELINYIAGYNSSYSSYIEKSWFHSECNLVLDFVIEKERFSVNVDYNSSDDSYCLIFVSKKIWTTKKLSNIIEKNMGILFLQKEKVNVFYIL